MMDNGRGRDRRVIVVLFGTMFAAVADNQIIVPLLPDIGEEFGIGPGRGGLLVSVYALAAAACSVLIGPVSDRRGRTVVLTCGLAAFAGATALCSVAWDFRSLLIFRAFTGAAAGALSMGITAFIGDYFPYQTRGTAMGLVMSGYFAALVIGVPLGSWLASVSTWRTAFLAFAAVAAVLWWPQWRVLPGLPQAGAPSAGLARSLADYRRVFEQRGPASAVIASLLVSASTVGFITYVGMWLRAVYRLSTYRIGLVFLVSGLAALVGSPVAGRMADRVGKRTVVILSSLVMAVCLAAIPWLTASLPMVYGTFFITSLAGAFRHAPFQALITGLVPDAERGALIALKNTCAEIGISAGTAVSGVLYRTWGYEAVGVSSAAVTIAAAVMLGLGVREPESTEEEPE